MSPEPTEATSISACLFYSCHPRISLSLLLSMLLQASVIFSYLPLHLLLQADGTQSILTPHGCCPEPLIPVATIFCTLSSARFMGQLGPSCRSSSAPDGGIMTLPLLFSLLAPRALHIPLAFSDSG